MFLGLSINEFNCKRKCDYHLYTNYCEYFRKMLNVLFLLIVPSIGHRLKT